MTIGLHGQNLIFLISQPRSGSTLLQRMLGSHPDIHTVSEPWLMLHPLYALQPGGYEAEYDADRARSALKDFLHTLSDGEGEYVEGLRRMYTYLYGRALAGSGKRYFLDKTPRYYLIIPELQRTFPEANFVILLRNPLAVLCSMLAAWVKDNWRSMLSLHWLKDDLVTAPRLLVGAVKDSRERCAAVHYEHLIRSPEAESRRLCERLGVDFVPEMIEYGRPAPPRWRFGDKKSVYQHTRPAAEYADRWMQSLDDPQSWRLASDYLEYLGTETLSEMGYPYDELRGELDSRRPRPFRLWPTFSLAWALEMPADRRSVPERGVYWLKTGAARLMRSLQLRGLSGTAAAALRKVV